MPKPPEGTQRAKYAHQRPKISRQEQLKKDGVAIAMPSNPAPHIISRLIEIGITETTGMGPAPLSWREIEAWQSAVNVRLAPWEARLMRQLSLAYITESRRAESETCPPPWRSEVTHREQQVELQRLKMVLG